MPKKFCIKCGQKEARSDGTGICPRCLFKEQQEKGRGINKLNKSMLDEKKIEEETEEVGPDLEENPGVDDEGAID